MLNVKRKLLLFRQDIWNKLSYFPRERAKKLELKVKQLEEQDQKNAQEEVDKIIKRMKRSEKFQKIVKKEYVVWKAVIRKKLISEIGCCEKCGTTSRPFTIDHIIPQKFLKSLGIKPEEDRNEDNFQLLCDLCNGRKASDFDFTTPKTYYLLLDYLKVLPKEPNPFKQKKLDTKKREEEVRAKIEKALKGTPYDPDLIEFTNPHIKAQIRKKRKK
jgi:5-methylcytosine-specific restriction endonuclease McrA